jgi:hypothetical protein
VDSAGYGAFTITQGVSIVAPQGVTAGITVFSGNGITINATSTDTIILRGLTINNLSSALGSSGIVFGAGGTLHVEGCVVNGFFNGNGISFRAGAKLEVKDSIFRDNFRGIFVNPASGDAPAMIEQVRLENGGQGMTVRESAFVTIRNSLASGNVTGFVAESDSAAPAELDIENCVASNNEVGIAVTSNSTGAALVRVSNSTVTHNGTGLQNNGFAPALLLSRGNNTVEGNTTNTGGTIGSYSAK